jgi:hypothetical protein
MKGAVIVDDHDKDFAGLKENEAQRTADAKKGFQLVIPYLKVNSQDGLLFREYLQRKEAKPVMLKIDLSLIRPDNRVEYELWYSSILDLSKDQLVDLGKY